MNYKLSTLAQHLNADLQGDADCLIDGVASLTNITPGKITFCENIKQKIPAQVTAIVLSPQLVKQFSGNALITQTPKLAFIDIVKLFHPDKEIKPSIHSTCIIGKNCQLSDSVSIGPHTVIEDNVTLGENVQIASGCYIGENVKIKNNCKLYANVSIYHDCQIGSNTILHSGVVIGADGFGFMPNAKQEWVKIPQIGAVIVGNDCEIGANSTIDRGMLEDTFIGNGVKIDDLCMIAHNVKIDDHTVIAGCTVVAGSTSIGKHCVIGGSTAIADHLVLGDQVMLSGAATVTRSLEGPGVYASGTSIQPRREWQKSVVRFRQLDKMYQRLKKLEEQL